MEANSTLVNIDEQTAPKLVAFVSSLIDEEGEGKGNELLETGNKLIDNRDTKGLIYLILNHSEKIISAEIESDTVGCFQALISIMFSLQNDSQSLEVLEKLVSCLVSDEKLKSKLRLKVLVSIFNMLVTPGTKYFVIKAIFKFALASKQSSIISKFHEKVDYWITAWKLDISSKRELYQLSSDILSQDSNESANALIYLVKYLDTFKGEVYPPDVQKRTIDAVISAIRSPVSSYKDRSKLYETLAKQQLGSDELTKLVELLRILCSDSLESYQSYLNANKGIFTQFKIDSETVLQSMKLLTLCTLASSEKLLKFNKIASALQIEVDEVEFWIVDAISQDLLEASIDQMNAEVRILRSANRFFNLGQWTNLKTRLEVLSKNLNVFLSDVKN